MKNLLNLTQYARGLHQDILELICINFVKIDVSLSRRLLCLKNEHGHFYVIESLSFLIA